jgi:hypothetical protein
MKNLLIISALLSAFSLSAVGNDDLIRTYANGDKYVGEYKDGARNGQGTFTWAGEFVEPWE